MKRLLLLWPLVCFFSKPLAAEQEPVASIWIEQVEDDLLEEDPLDAEPSWMDRAKQGFSPKEWETPVAAEPKEDPAPELQAVELPVAAEPEQSEIPIASELEQTPAEQPIAAEAEQTELPVAAEHEQSEVPIAAEPEQTPAELPIAVEQPVVQKRSWLDKLKGLFSSEGTPIAAQPESTSEPQAAELSAAAEPEQAEVLIASEQSTVQKRSWLDKLKGLFFSEGTPVAARLESIPEPQAEELSAAAEPEQAEVLIASEQSTVQKRSWLDKLKGLFSSEGTPVAAQIETTPELQDAEPSVAAAEPEQAEVLIASKQPVAQKRSWIDKIKGLFSSEGTPVAAQIETTPELQDAEPSVAAAEPEQAEVLIASEQPVVQKRSWLDKIKEGFSSKGWETPAAAEPAASPIAAEPELNPVPNQLAAAKNIYETEESPAVALEEESDYEIEIASDEDLEAESLPAVAAEPVIAPAPIAVEEKLPAALAAEPVAEVELPVAAESEETPAELPIAAEAEIIPAQPDAQKEKASWIGKIKKRFSSERKETPVAAKPEADSSPIAAESVVEAELPAAAESEETPAELPIAAEAEIIPAQPDAQKEKRSWIGKMRRGLSSKRKENPVAAKPEAEPSPIAAEPVAEVELTAAAESEETPVELPIAAEAEIIPAQPDAQKEKPSWIGKIKKRFSSEEKETPVAAIQEAEPSPAAVEETLAAEPEAEPSPIAAEPVAEAELPVAAEPEKSPEQLAAPEPTFMDKIKGGFSSEGWETPVAAEPAVAPSPAAVAMEPEPEQARGEMEAALPAAVVAEAPKETCEPEAQPQDRKRVLKGILFLSDLSQVEKVPDPQFEGVELQALHLKGKEYDQFLCLIADHFGKKIDREMILAIRDEVVGFYKTIGRPVIAIDIPPQDITDGVLQYVVTETTIGKIAFSGAKYYNQDQLAKMMRLQPGEPLDTGTLISDIDWINRSPYRRADAILGPGEKDNSTDIEIRMTERFPFRVYAGVDNTGNRVTGQNRLFAGFSWANAFQLDHTFSFQGTSSSDFDKFYSYTLNYVAPMPWRHILMFYGGYSKMHPEITGFHSHAESIQASGRYQIPIPSKRVPILQEFDFGVDYKNTNNNLTFLSAGEIPIITKRVEYLQLMLGYSFGKSEGSQKFNLNVQLFGSPGKVFEDSSDAHFNALKPGTTNLYMYGRFMGSYTYTFQNKASIVLMDQIQLSTNALLSNEELGVGGYDTVRGYREREVDADNAFVGNLEVHAPKMELFCTLWDRKKYLDQIDFYGFIDYAITSEIHPQAGESSEQQLMSTGFGIHYNLDTLFSFRLDWGLRLFSSQFEEAFGSKIHFGLMAGY